MCSLKVLFKLNVVLLLARLGPQVVHSKPATTDSDTARSSRDEQQQPSPVSPTSFESASSTSTSQIQQEGPIRAIHYHFDQEMEPFMQLHKFNTSTDGNNVTCNDGSPAGYYKRLNNHSKSWIIYLQGGGYCGSEETCQLRWRRSAHLMSSNHWPQSMSGKFNFVAFVSQDERGHPRLKIVS